jgi:hypothetical protein
VSDREYDAGLDLYDSYFAAVAELRRRHLAGVITLDCACTCTMERQGRTGNPTCPCWIDCACFDDPPHPAGARGMTLAGAPAERRELHLPPAPPAGGFEGEFP